MRGGDGRKVSGRAGANRLSRLLPALVTLALWLVPAPVAAEDTLILSDGSIKTGALAGCVADVCTLDGAAVPRASIYYIGLDAALPPPAPQDPLRDEVHLRDGSIHPGPLAAIDAAGVVTGTMVHPRDRVAWIWLTPLLAGQAPAPPAASPGSETEEWPLYDWEGTIRVENRYNDAKYGRHRWQAAYRLELREVSYGAFEVNGRTVANISLEPVELDYEFDADQVWQLWVRADAMETVTMSGRASGQLRGDRLTFTMLGGHLWGFEAPLAAPHRAPDRFGSLKEASEYGSAQQAAAPEPGWYRLDLDFEEGWPDAEQRALYAGIERGGTRPVYTDPDFDFLSHIPVCMPQPTWVTGRLDRPDQAEVRGGFSYPYRGSDDLSETPNEITVEWSFTRTPQ